MRVALIGGTGFVGEYLVDALLDAGHEVSLLVRAGSAGKLRRADRCRVVEGGIDSPAAISSVAEDSNAVIYAVGILREFPRRGITFEATQYEGVVRTIDAARSAGARRLLLMSANGVRRAGTAYQETKYRAEQAALASGLDATIFRPSVIFGDPRGKMEIATQLYRDMVGRPVPAVGLHTGWNPRSGAILMSPVWVGDVVDAFVAALESPAATGKTYPLGGPEALSWPEMIRRVASAAGRRKLVLPMPVALMKVAATLFDWSPLFPVTRDQLVMLRQGNAVDPNELRQLIGRDPAPFSQDGLEYLRG